MSSILNVISSFFERDLACASDDCISPADTKEAGTTAPLFDIAIATIFAREILEGCIIIGQYRTVIYKSADFKDDEVKQKRALRAVTMSAVWASAVAVVLAVSICLGLYFAGKKFDNATAEIIEGVSKLVAAVCVLQLSAKVPEWLGLYTTKHTNEDGMIAGLDERSIKFNVAWNLWREVAECGVFLIPYMLGESARSIPISAIVGCIVGIAGGYGTYYASYTMTDLFWVVFFLSNLTGWLAIGLFTGGMHEFEEVWGMTPYVWKIDGDFWSHKYFPMVMIKPFGYSSKRTVLQFVCFWLWIAITIAYHYYHYQQSEKRRAALGDKKEQSKAEQFDENA